MRKTYLGAMLSFSVFVQFQRQSAKGVGAGAQLNARKWHTAVMSTRCNWTLQQDLLSPQCLYKVLPSAIGTRGRLQKPLDVSARPSAKARQQKPVQCLQTKICMRHRAHNVFARSACGHASATQVQGPYVLCYVRAVLCMS